MDIKEIVKDADLEAALKNHQEQIDLANGRIDSVVQNKQSKIACGTIDPITGGVVGVDGDVYIQIVE